MTTPIPAPPSTGSRPTLNPGATPSPSPGASPAPAPTTGGGNIIDRALDKVGDLASPVTDITDGITATRAWISNRHNWTRVLWFTTGVVCFAIGAAMLAGRPATQAVATVVPAGKALKAVTRG